MIKHVYLFLIGFIFLLRVTALSQIGASTLSGCAPLVGVTFTSTPAANPVWNFGDGTTSSLQNPIHTFSTPQTYTVTYSATGINQQTLIIKVFGKPSPHFSATTPTKGCIPLSVSFTDNSTGGGGTSITNWQWAFGDGGTNASNSANQTYLYNVGGQFNVSVIVTDLNGCDSSFTINNLVSASQKPTIVISPTSPSACLPPLTVTFTSTGTTSHVPPPQANTLTYTWTFSGGSTSNLAGPPAQTYTVAGVFPQTLTVTDINGCSNSLTRNVIIQNPTAVFAIADTVCTHDSTYFKPHGSTAGTQIWSYGDGQTGTDSAHFYNTPGTYQVKLTVSNGACSNSVTHTIYAEQPTPNFSITPTYMCSLPKTISITNLSTPHNSGFVYHWSYMQSYSQYGSTLTTTVTQTNPTFTLSYLDTNQYTINTWDFKDSIEMTLTTVHGCVVHKTIQYIDTIFIPTARFLPDKYQGCVPLTVNFTDSSRVGPKEHITSWKYIFGDGSSTTLTSAPANTVHTYTTVGIYYPTLVIQTQNGCGDTSYAIKIEVGSPPVPTFSVSPTNICIGDSVHLVNTTPTSYSVDTWHYSGDGNYYASSCSDDANVSWPFTHATGAQNISMTACFRGCCSTTTQNSAVTVKGPLATFSTTMDCDSSHVFNFFGNISDALNWTWNFGDGNVITNSTSVNIAHTYTTTGDYNVVLTAYNSGTGCSPSSYTVTVHVRNIKANFTYNTLLCSGIPYLFDASASTDVYSYGSNGYIWFWGDGTHIDIDSAAAIGHTFTPTGPHIVTLIVKDINGCEDTLRKEIRTYSVTASFVPSKTTMCVNSAVTFSNTSVSDTAITSYSWNFGDGVGTSAQQSPTYTYNITNPAVTNVTVTLVVTNTLGCTGTYTTTLNISRPNASFVIASNKNICSGDSVKFTSVNSYPHMTWSYGDGTGIGPTPPLTSTWHTYTASGAYTSSLSVTDAAGCSDIKLSTQNVNVQNIPQVIITSAAFNNHNLCYPYQAQFTDNSIANVFFYRNWNLGNGTVTNNLLSSVSTLYALPGTYTISLTETTTNGCQATLTNTIIINGPIADFTLTPSTICKGQSITFGIKDTTDVNTWHWDFGDGTDTTAVSPISHTYNFHPPNSTGTTNATLVYWSKDSSCAQTKTYPVNIKLVIADFNRNHELTKADTAHCLGIRDTFTNISTGADTYGWNFGNGAVSSTFSPQYQYTVAGTYNVELYIKNNASGCVDTLIKKMIIYPPFTETTTGDSICKNTNGQITATGTAVSYTWTPSSGLSASNISSPVATPSMTTTYTLYATDGNGCKDTTTALVFVQQPPNPITWDTTIVIGQSPTFPGSQGPGYTYTWSPAANLSCTNCPKPAYNGTVDAHYIETFTDTRGCFTGQSTFDIKVEPLSSIDVPSAFTPNGDGTNDIIYVAGWGLKKLNYFRIYNRWGELVFESNDLKVGWDGTYKGTPQNIETYVYQASAETYISSEPITKKGYIKLLR
jgi:gliding motility-associated-like protein